MNWSSATQTQEPNPELMIISQALCDIRDFWVEIRLTLRDLFTELDSEKRDEVLTEVERYLASLKGKIK